MDDACSRTHIEPSVVLSDAQSLSRRGTRLLLERQGYRVVGETDNGSEAVTLADRLQPDVLITDLDLGAVPGLEVIRQVRRASPSTAILVLTETQMCPSVVGAMQGGARGYVLRTSDPDEFLRALDAVAHGDMYICPRVARHLAAARCSDAEKEDCRGLGCLTSRELQTTRLVAEGFSSPQIAGMMGISAATVDRHRANIMRKLGVHSVSALVLFAVRCGLVDIHRASA